MVERHFESPSGRRPAAFPDVNVTQEPPCLGEAGAVAQPREGVDRCLCDITRLARGGRRFGSQANVVTHDRRVRLDRSLVGVRGVTDGLRQCCFSLIEFAAVQQRIAEVELDASTLALVVDSELESGREPSGGVVIGEQPRRRFGRSDVVVDRAADAGESARKGEVVREIREEAVEVFAVPALERFADTQVKLGAAHACQPIVKRAAHELVRETVRDSCLAERLDHPACHCLVGCGDHLGIVAQQAQLEIGAGNGRDFEHGDRLGSQPRQAVVHDVADALRAAELGRRLRQTYSGVRDVDRLRFDERSPELAQQERRAVGELSESGRDVRVCIRAGGAFDKLGDVVVAQSAEPETRHTLEARQVGERRRELGPDVLALVPIHDEHEHAGFERRASDLP